MVRIAVFGATGQTGRRVVSRAVSAGHQVRALSRHGRPAGAPAEDGRVEWAAVDIRDPQRVAEAVRDVEAVISTVGVGRTRAETTVYSEGIRNVIAALPEGARLAVVSAAPVAPMPGARRLLRAVLWRFFGASYRDMARMEAELTQHPELAWVCLRPPYLREGPPTGSYRVYPDAPPRNIRIATGDLADALIGAVTGSRPEWRFAWVA